MAVDIESNKYTIIIWVRLQTQKNTNYWRSMALYWHYGMSSIPSFPHYLHVLEPSKNESNSLFAPLLHIVWKGATPRGNQNNSRQQKKRKMERTGFWSMLRCLPERKNMWQRQGKTEKGSQRHAKIVEIFCHIRKLPRKPLKGACPMKLLGTKNEMKHEHPPWLKL